MKIRTAHVDKIRLNSLTYSSMFEIGDTNSFTPSSKIIAVQKEGGIQSGEGFDFKKYPIFKQEPPELPVTQNVLHKSYNHNEAIQVNNVDITSVAGSSIIQVGGIKHIDSESRIKHFRILQDEQNNN